MRTLLVVVLLATTAPAIRAADRIARPFEKRGEFTVRNVVDAAVLSGLRKRAIRPARPCSDEVFFRRVHLDVIGTLPEPADVTRFLDDRRPDKRDLVIDELLQREEFAHYWAQKWCDLLRVKAEFPVNLWPNAVQAYHRWIHDAIRDGMPYDRMAREMLTSSGSNFRVPAVNFYRAVQSREPAALAQVAALTFLGSRIEKWSPEDRDGLAAFFSRVAYKRTVEWKEEIVLLDPAPRGPVEALLPDGTRAYIRPGDDPRKVFADWLVRPGNPWFAKVVVNRVWAWLMGRGIVHEPDDFRADNPASNPALLEILAKELVLSDYDLKHIYRLILNSSTYQQSPVPRSKNKRTEPLFGHYIVRRLDAEVLIDALCKITGTTEKYVSPIPEPFTFVPETMRSIELADGSISSPFLEMFGRPTRDTGLWSERNNHPTPAQRLHLLNSSDIQRRITEALRTGRLVRGGRDPGKAIEALYLTILSRRPTEDEMKICLAYARSGRANLQVAAEDLVWTLVNSKEFLYRH
jgi:hypothetical protein